jgi:formylglycine-generating enzyme
MSAAIAPVWQEIGIDLVPIPAGEFLYGETRTPMTLPAFRLARTPVTQAQWQAYVLATGARVPYPWVGGTCPPGKAKHPVVNVSWDEIQGFCAWARVRLPTDEEWERGARGVDGRLYPWGNEPPAPHHCNVGFAVTDTQPVGSFPAGASPEGLLDMGGNVWEWTADAPPGSTLHRMLRGGAWNLSAGSVPAHTRLIARAANFYDSFGFRVAADI